MDDEHIIIIVKGHALQCIFKCIMYAVLFVFNGDYL